MPVALHNEPDGDHSRSGSSSDHNFPTLEHFRVKHLPPAAYYIPDFITQDEEEFLLRKIADSPQPKWKSVASGRSRLQYWGGTMSKNSVLLPEPFPDFLTTYPDIIERIQRFLDRTDERSEATNESSTSVLAVNQVLVNEYQPGQGISPHEDGPAFQPLVATLSLGSHTVLDLHHYLSASSPSPPMTASEAQADQVERLSGRPIAAIPLAHLLVMPRSLLILSSTLYTSHLHGISERFEDIVSAAPGHEGVVAANADLLGDAGIADSLRNNKVWRQARGTRTSLTFRHANRTLKGGLLSMTATGALRRH
ncbi:hypothetical protein BCR39DRAFT_220208 [Naematelia encephala]|uniref:Fe2OG dioxygenase domain-containing protein n=1 Tax=Naematelia encephala TaxID=71784 RepID=A0A1Y2AZ70_9TREE|nr:hypothetical protein BCR39DRAFT_220208 [Naematelia encephala]